MVIDNGNGTDTIKTIGKKWKQYQKTKYGQNSQPCYVIIDNEENILAGPYGFDKDVQHFINFLNEGKDKFNK